MTDGWRDRTACDRKSDAGHVCNVVGTPGSIIPRLWHNMVVYNVQPCAFCAGNPTAVPGIVTNWVCSRRSDGCDASDWSRGSCSGCGYIVASAEIPFFIDFAKLEDIVDEEELKGLLEINSDPPDLEETGISENTDPEPDEDDYIETDFLFF